MTKYPEIEKLKSYFKNHHIHISEDIESVRPDLFFAEVVIDGFKFRILIDDEYGDFEKHNKLFKWFLVLYAIEVYEESEDLLEWSKEISVSPEQFLNYYRDFNLTYKRIVDIIGEIDACISGFNYTLRTGVIRALENDNTDN